MNSISLNADQAGLSWATNASDSLPGDLLFVPAGLVHRFEDYAELGVWVVFYGPRTPKSSV